jgi:hypothetical protein
MTKQELIEENIFLRSKLRHVAFDRAKLYRQANLWRNFGYTWGSPNGVCPVCKQIMAQMYKCTCGWDSSSHWEQLSPLKRKTIMTNYKHHGTIYDKPRR